LKHDQGKPPFALIPPEALTEIAKVFGFGADKYGINNWREDGDHTSWLRTYSSIQRHLNAWHAGEDLDPESGSSHLTHAATQLIILMIHQMEHPEVDNRYKPKTKEIK
jgi:hypothetical protein